MVLFRGLTAVLLVAGLLLDLYSVVLYIRRNRDGHGRSGVAGASWFLYLTYCMARQQLALLAILTIFHVLCHFVIPLAHKQLTAPDEPETEE